MKKIKFILIFVSLILLPFLNPGQPDPGYNGNGSSVGNTPVGNQPGGAPIDGGSGILITLGLGYSIKKIYAVIKKNR